MPFAIGSSGEAGGVAIQSTKVGGMALGGDLIYKAETVQAISIPASAYGFASATSRLWSWDSGRPPIDAGLAPSGVSRFLQVVGLIRSGSVRRFELRLSAFATTQGTSPANEDFNTDFETRGIVTFTLSTGESVTLNMANNSDVTEPYSFDTFVGGNAAFDRVFNALSRTVRTESGTLTLTLPA